MNRSMRTGPHAGQGRGLGQARRGLLAGLMAAGLVGCGGGSEEKDDTVSPVTPVTLTASDDVQAIQPLLAVDLLANDLYGTAAATAGSSGNVVLSIVGSLPTGLSLDGEQLVAGANVTPGSIYTITYQICQATLSSNCARATARLTVPYPVILAADDSFNLLPGDIGDVLANDVLAGRPTVAGELQITASGTLPNGISLSAQGAVSVAAGTAAGTQSFSYQICQATYLPNCASAQVSVTVPEVGSLTGRAIDGATGSGVAGVTVQATGRSTTTASDGTFNLSGVRPGERVAVNFTSTTHAEMASVAAVTASGTTDVQARLTAVAATVTLDATAGGTAAVSGSSAQVQLPASGLATASGVTASGNVSVALTPIAAGTDSTLMPGDYQTVSSGALTPIESFGALNVQIRDAAGQALNLRSGQTATIRIPVSTRSASTPATIPLFYLDTTTGNWVQEGTATLQGSGSTAWYEGTVSHFSTWNADQVYNTVQVTGCVVDESGNRIASAAISTDGINYTGTSRATTDSAGNFTVPIRKSGVATLAARNGSRNSATLSVGPYAADTTLPACLVLGQTATSLTMKLTWGARPSDLDSHLWTPSGAHVYYSSRGTLVSTPYANLDVDDTSSYGPEVVTVSRLMVGTYRYSIHNYSGYGSGPIASSGARVELNLPGRTVELFVPPSSGESTSTRYWNLFTLTVDAACNITVNRLNSWTSSAPSVGAATPVYCTASGS